MSHAQYSSRNTVVEGIEVVRLTDAARNVEVSVVPSIGNIAYEMKVNGKNVFWLPYPTLTEFKKRPSLAGNPFLAPWANRIEGWAFFANGKKYVFDREMGNVRSDQNGNPIHGLLTFSPLWQVKEVKSDGAAAQVTSRLEFWRYPDLMAQFPFAHTIEMTYRLAGGTLEVETRIQNHAAEPMPVAIGYHPYFRVHDAPRDDWKVHLSARDHLVLSDKLIPTGERKPVAFAYPLPLKGVVLDDVFTSLATNGQGAEFWVEGAKERVTVTYGQKYRIAVVYAPAGRNFICFEPMSAPTNAFNLSHAGTYKGMDSIPPGGEWKESYWIKASGF
ncbi:MAG TPA: aldose 1-epimerase [Bryobacteraceae bacterium]|nr:aldose 1-epimerase [Bryobacteraceae bacterium]